MSDVTHCDAIEDGARKLLHVLLMSRTGASHLKPRPPRQSKELRSPVSRLFVGHVEKLLLQHQFLVYRIHNSDAHFASNRVEVLCQQRIHHATTLIYSTLRILQACIHTQLNSFIIY